MKQKPTIVDIACNIIFAQYEKGVPEGRECAKKTIGAPQRTPAERLLIITNIIAKKSAKEAQILLKSLHQVLTNDRHEFLQTVHSINIPAQQKDELITLLIDSKFITKREVNCFSIASHYDDSKQNEDAIYFYKKALQPDLIADQVHSLYINLARCYSAIGKTTLGKEYYDKAYALEVNGKVGKEYQAQYGLITYFLMEVDKAPTAILPINFLLLGLSYEPNHQGMLQRAKKYLAYLKSDQCQDVDQCLEAYLTLSAIPSIQGQLPELFAKLGRMPKPESTKQLNKLAKCFLLANNAQRAAELFLESLNYSTQDSQALYGLAECNYALGHFNSAEALIFKSLAIIHQASEEAFTMYQFLACLYIDLTEGRKAITFASKYLERYPDHLATKCNLIKGYIYEQNIVHAKRLLTEAAKAHGQNRQLDECTEILKVQTAMLNKSMGSASTQIDSINPEVSIYQNLSNGQFEVVKKQALELITKGESAHLAHLALGQVYEIEGNYQQALVHLEEASKVMHTPEVMMVMLRSYIRLQDYDHAQPLAIHLLATCRATHGKKDIRNLLILYTHITEIALSTNNIAEAIRIFETLKKEEKGTKEEMESLSKHLAYLYNSVDDFAQANIHITDAIKYSTRPDSSLFRMQGNIQLKSQDIAGAIQSYKKSLEIEPRNAGLNYNLGIYYLLFKKDVAKAKKYTQLALELDPSIDNILDEVLPAELKELLTAEDRVEEKQELLTPPSVARDKEEEKEDHTLNAAMAVLDIQKPSVAELTVAPPVTITELSEEQLKHKYLQNEKKRTLEQLSAERAQASAYETEPYWMIPSMGKISLHDDRVTKLSIGNCNPEKSHLHAMLDNKLENESKWEDRVIRGKIARKKGEQGIRLLTQEEQNKVQQKLGAGYVAKIKVLGQDGDKRYYGRSFSAVGGPENRLLFFDRLVDKHAAMNR